MKDRHKRYTRKISALDEPKSRFSIAPILINAIAIAVMLTAYYYITHANLFPDYQTYIYWTINVLVCYNILVASTRSFVAPIVTLLIAGFILITIYSYNGAYLSVNEDWGLLAVGVVGLLISMAQLL
jgi:hypothetical protein